MLKSIHTTMIFLLAVSLLALPGCSPSDRPDGLPTLYPTEITVIQGGVPLEGANVVLVGDQPWAIGGGTDGNGVARIFTHGRFEGAPAGQFSVLVTKSVTEGAPTQEELDNPSFSGSRGTIYSTVNRQFSVQASTPLTIEIVPGNNSQTFDVGAAVREAQARP